jgi:glucokinase
MASWQASRRGGERGAAVARPVAGAAAGAAAVPGSVPAVATVLAIDIGGTKLEAGIVDETGRILARDRVATESTGSADALLDDIATLVNRVRRGHEPAGCGVGCGGPMLPGGATVSPVNIPAWREFPLRDRLAEVVGLPVFVDNDAKALARAEGWLGAARGVTDYVALVVSTGVGGGIVLDGRLLHGAHENAGHIGHMIVEPEGRLCGCGARGCLEAEASGTAIAASTGRPAAEATAEVRERTGRLVGRVVGSVANLLDLQLAVVAGSVALGFGDAFFNAAQRELDAVCALEFARGARIIRAQLGDDGPLIGAAAVGWQALGQDAGPA